VIQRPEVVTFADRASFADGAAKALVEEMRDVIVSRGHCRLALSGGTTPRAVFARLAAPALTDGGLDWTRLEVFWTDERAVPPDHPASNYWLAWDTWLRHVPIPAGQVHRIEGERPPAEAAARYTQTLGTTPLDVVILGMGADGHTASLFPGSAALASVETVVVTDAPVAPHTRVSLSLRTINAARSIDYWVTGSDKADRVAEVFREITSGRPELPAARVAPAGGRVRWFTDADAARRLAHGAPVAERGPA
jgi:6-phosphogluconolactonase